MNLIINLQPLLDFLFGQPVWLVVWGIFWRGGWLLLVLFVLLLYRDRWLKKKQAEYAQTLSWTVLAIDVPRENLQTLLAIEQIFAGLAGAHEAIGFWEKWWEGKTPASFSFEIVSLDGYIQFLIRTPTPYRDLVEAVMFAHYPDAEIVEVHDYTHRLPHEFPNETHDLWGGEIILAEHTALPIRTHTYFEDKVSGEIKDPIAPLLEIFSKLQMGEELWLQIVITPNDGSWKEEAQHLVSELIGEHHEPEETIWHKIGDVPVKLMAFLGEALFPGEEGEHADSGGSEEQNKLAYLTPGQKDVVAAVEDKAAKIGFDTVIRLIYAARKEVFAKVRVTSVMGTLHQFGTLHMNSFKVGRKVSGNKYWRKKESLEESKTQMLHHYAERAPHGPKHYIMNIEELATLWHFPVALVKTPLIQKTEAKKAEPPFRLPVEVTAPRPTLHPAGYGGHGHDDKKSPAEHHEKDQAAHEASKHPKKPEHKDHSVTPNNLPVV